MTASPAFREDVRQHRGKTPLLVRVRIVLAIVISMGLALVAGVIVSLLNLVGPVRWRRIYAEVVCRYLACLGLWLCGVKLRVHDRELWSENEQVVYISNHTSSLDMFAIIALGLPNTRYFLSGFLKRIPMIGLLGNAIGIFWTLPQTDTEGRRNLFRNACEELRQSGESVFLTPEGQHIGVFNRGAFHLATELGARIVPFYIDIPNDVDPGPWVENQNLDTRPGTVDIFFKEPIDTRDWQIDQVDQYRKQVRSLYAEWTQQYRGYLPEQYQ